MQVQVHTAAQLLSWVRPIVLWWNGPGEARSAALVRLLTISFCTPRYCTEIKTIMNVIPLSSEIEHIIGTPTDHVRICKNGMSVTIPQYGIPSSTFDHGLCGTVSVTSAWKRLQDHSGSGFHWDSQLFCLFQQMCSMLLGMPLTKTMITMAPGSQLGETIISHHMPWIKFINSSKSHDISWYPHGFGQLGIRGLEGLDQFTWSAKHRHWALILPASATWCELKGTSDAGRRTRDDFPSGRNLP